MYNDDRKERRISIQSMGNKKILRLNDLIEAIPYLNDKKNFILKFYNHSLNFNYFGYTGIQNDCLDWKEIELNKNYVEDAKVFKFDKSIHDWTSSPIVSNQTKKNSTE